MPVGGKSKERRKSVLAPGTLGNYNPGAAKPGSLLKHGEKLRDQDSDKVS